MIDPVARAWRAVNPTVPVPAVLEASARRTDSEGTPADPEQAKRNRAYMRDYARRRRSGGNSPRVPFSAKSRASLRA